MRNATLEDFYKEMATKMPADIAKEIGHFNVFELANLLEKAKGGHMAMPYNRRAYYKISLISGKNRAEYADKVIDIANNALLFATPKIPYNWLPQEPQQSGHFCIFTSEFLAKNKIGIALDSLPIFQPGAYPVFHISEQERRELEYIFLKMHKELASSYLYKYDLLRNYVLELIHYGQKLQPITTLYAAQNASERISSLFIELLERQFPIESQQQRLTLRTASDYADRLAVHVNHLNKVLKENTGKTTTDLIGSRIIQEAKILLRQTDWTISEISYCLGYEELAHFSNFFRRHTSLTPVAFRS